MKGKRSWKKGSYALLAVIMAASYVQAQDILSNQAAYIPSQCYTRTIDTTGNAHNPCYACHTQGVSPNFIHDASLQQTYDFPEEARFNHWDNLFKDRHAQRGAITDAHVLDYVRTSNYQSATGPLLLPQRLEKMAPSRDRNGNGRWDGYMPDAFFRFDAQGFDHGPDGRMTWWRSFLYYPFLGTFWPANGSTDDVLIRLPPPFRRDAKGHDDKSIYLVNLAITEALIRRESVPLPEACDEAVLGVDLDRDGVFGQVKMVAYAWDPGHGVVMRFVGEAGKLQDQGLVHATGGLYPEGTEFLHSVRYLDVDQQGRVAMAARMKELRYARKFRYLNYAALQDLASSDETEQLQHPDRRRPSLAMPSAADRMAAAGSTRVSSRMPKGSCALRIGKRPYPAWVAMAASGLPSTRALPFPEQSGLGRQAGGMAWAFPGFQSPCATMAAMNTPPISGRIMPEMSFARTRS